MLTVHVIYDHILTALQIIKVDSNASENIYSRAMYFSMVRLIIRYYTILNSVIF